MFRSTDDGASWVAANTGLTNTNVQALLACPNGAGSTDFYVAAFGDGVFRSTDYGASWVAGSGGGRIYSLAFRPNPAGGNLLYAGSTVGFHWSSNDGGNWHSSNSGLTDPHIMSPAVRVR